MRTLSILEQSTRYCNFSKDKFDNQVSFCKPSWIILNSGQYNVQFNEKLSNEELFIVGDGYLVEAKEESLENRFLKECFSCEAAYLRAIKSGQQPQQARELLPLCTATEAVYTGFAKDWRHFFSLRYFETTGKVHPNMMELSTKMKEEAIKANIWDDIHSDPSSDN